MPLATHDINDATTFAAATTRSRNLAGVYFFYALDCLVEFARAAAIDFLDRPQLSTQTNVVGELTRLHARYGHEETFPSRRQRYQIYHSLFGAQYDDSASEVGSFPRLRDELFEACATFVESKFMDEESLRENARQKHVQFRQYLIGLEGASLDWSRNVGLSNITETVAYTILRDQGVTAIYGVGQAATAAYPYAFDNNADILVEEVSAHAERSGHLEAGHMTREHIVNKQRAAIEGARALASAIDFPTTSDSNSMTDDTDQLIRRCYTWSTALKADRYAAEDGSTADAPTASYPSE